MLNLVGFPSRCCVCILLLLASLSEAFRRRAAAAAAAAAMCSRAGRHTQPALRAINGCRIRGYISGRCGRPENTFAHVRSRAAEVSVVVGGDVDVVVAAFTLNKPPICCCFCCCSVVFSAAQYPLTPVSVQPKSTPGFTGSFVGRGYKYM